MKGLELDLKVKVAVGVLVMWLSSEVEEAQFVQSKRALQQFVKILVKEYPLVFKEGSGSLEVPEQVDCPYEISLRIRKKNDK